MVFQVGPDIRRPDRSLIEKFSEAEVTTLGHTTDFGFPRGLTPTNRADSFAGPAVTVKVPSADGTAMHYAMDFLKPGDVLVIDHSGETDRSCFGGNLAAMAKHKGIAGVVVNGSVNDFQELLDLQLPVFSLGITPHTTRLLGLEGEINKPVCVGGVVVIPGDIVFADGDGVAIIEQDKADFVVDKILAMQERLAARDSIRRVNEGLSLAELSGARSKFEEGLENPPNPGPTNAPSRSL